MLRQKAMRISAMPHKAVNALPRASAAGNGLIPKFPPFEINAQAERICIFLVIL